MMKELFGIRRAVLPRVLTIDQVKHVIDNTDVEIEVFGFRQFVCDGGKAVASCRAMQQANRPICKVSALRQNPSAGNNCPTA